MGFVHSRPDYKLIFDGNLSGLEVVAKAAGIGDYLAISEMAGTLATIPPDPSDVAKLRKLFEAFAKQLVSWNLEEPEGTPVPTTLKGLLSQDPRFVARIILAWMDAVAGTRTEEGIESTLPVEMID